MLRLALVLSLVATSLLAADPNLLARAAVQGDAGAIQALRELGQPGVDALMAIGARGDVIDAVCKQRDCGWSGLFWHTDLEAAKRVAKETKRPILSLRLLGNLDEELSCANSRYFRTLLYSNKEIRAYLRENYVLHWQPVRSAPVITIDFGDGRRMQRTITGNSIHYVLDAGGHPLDAIPGLYAPPVFLTLLREGVALDRAAGGVHLKHVRQAALRDYHDSFIAPAGKPESPKSKRLDAWVASLRTASKSYIEAPMFDKVSFGTHGQDVRKDLAKLLEHAVATKTIDDNAVALIREKRAAAPDARLRSDDSLAATLAILEQTLAADTRLNEELHARIHEWFSAGLVTTVDALNERVYRDLFRAPNSDPWAGLLTDSAFTGIAGEGLIVAKQ